MALSLLWWIVLMTGINGLLALGGAFSLIISRKNLHKILLFLVAFAVGALLGGSFFHLIPEALSELDSIKVVLLLVIGFVVFFFIERFLHWHHCHKDHCDTHPFTYLILFGDGIHNFIDGVIIASAFIMSVPFGIITSLLIMIHELPQEIGDFGVLVYGGLTRGKALFYNFLSQLTAVLGGILGFLFLGIEEQAVIILPIAAGGFLYIALMDLIPEVLKEKDKRKRLLNIGFIVLGLLVLYSAKVFIG